MSLGLSLGHQKATQLMFDVFFGLSKRWTMINYDPALNCTTVSNHDEQVTYEVMPALEN